jgi:5-methylcytosine-specific restriction protein A
VSTRRVTAGVYSRKRPLGPNGERICYNCGGSLPKGKPFNCSSKCSEEWRCKTSPSHLRFVIQQRDKGVCALCKVDTISLRQEYDAIVKRLKQTYTYRYQDGEAGEFLKAHGIPWGRITSDWWDADHIVPVTEGNYILDYPEAING